MSSLRDKVETFFTGTSAELHEKVGYGPLAFGLYSAEIFCCVWFYIDALNGKFNPYAAPLAFDGTTRIVQGYINIFERQAMKKENTPGLPGIIGTIKEIKQYFNRRKRKWEKN